MNEGAAVVLILAALALIFFLVFCTGDLMCNVNSTSRDTQCTLDLHPILTEVIW